MVAGNEGCSSAVASRTTQASESAGGQCELADQTASTGSECQSSLSSPVVTVPVAQVSVHHIVLMIPGLIIINIGKPFC